ncbi:MAG: hypothetical protein SH868_01745 [Bythopirellula sp.]|nr:hypothetical protein [Bythopirellula sp.]
MKVSDKQTVKQIRRMIDNLKGETVILKAVLRLEESIFELLIVAHAYSIANQILPVVELPSG